MTRVDVPPMPRKEDYVTGIDSNSQVSIKKQHSDTTTECYHRFIEYSSGTLIATSCFSSIHNIHNITYDNTTNVSDEMAII